MRWRGAVLAFLLAAAATAAEQSLTLKVEGWHSKGDAYKTEQAVRQVKGVRSASADSGARQIVVVFDDSQASVAEIQKAIVAAGYLSHR